MKALHAAFYCLCVIAISMGCLRTKTLPNEMERMVAGVRRDSANFSEEAERLTFEADRYATLLREHPQDLSLYSLVLEALEQLYFVSKESDLERLHGQGKEIGRECLRRNGAWAVMEDLSGGRLTVQALRRLDPSDLPCVRGLLFHWIRWVELRGPTARLDLRAIALLADRSVELALDDLTWREHWGLAMVASLELPSEEARNRAEFHFQAAIALAPGLATPAIDRLAGQVRQGVYSEQTTEALRQLGAGHYAVHSSAAWSVQNQHALKRAIGLLAQLREVNMD